MKENNDDRMSVHRHEEVAAKRAEFGSYQGEASAIQKATGEAIAALARKRLHKYIPEKNTRNFTHGTGWSSPASPEMPPNEMITIQDIFEVKWADVADHKLSIVGESIMTIATNMGDQQVKSLFEAVSNTCDRTGNVVSAAKRPFPEAFIEMLEKIEFGVGADGEVSLPSIFVGPDMGDQIMKELEAQPPEFQARAEALIEQKKADALASEVVRLKRFRTSE